MSNNMKLILINLPQLSNSKWVGFVKGQPIINQGNQILRFGCLAFEIGTTWIFFKFHQEGRLALQPKHVTLQDGGMWKIHTRQALHQQLPIF